MLVERSELVGVLEDERGGEREGDFEFRLLDLSLPGDREKRLVNIRCFMEKAGRICGEGAGIRRETRQRRVPKMRCVSVPSEPRARRRVFGCEAGDAMPLDIKVSDRTQHWTISA